MTAAVNILFVVALAYCIAVHHALSGLYGSGRLVVASLLCYYHGRLWRRLLGRPVPLLFSLAVIAAVLWDGFYNVFAPSQGVLYLLSMCYASLCLCLSALVGWREQERAAEATPDPPPPARDGAPNPRDKRDDL